MIERPRYNEAAIAHRLTNLLVVILAASVVVALALTYWTVVRSEVLATRPDNPRVVEAELRVQRGSILDRNNVILAENVGPLDQQSRSYPLGDAGPAVGHYSLRFGAAGIEAAYDTILRGADVSAVTGALNALMHIPPTGRDVRLTLDGTLQTAGSRLMQGQQGALVLLELGGTPEQPTAEIRALISQPWYDPNKLDEQLASLGENGTSSFFNRATQGQYQPGLVVLPLLAAAAIDASAVDPVDPFVAAASDGDSEAAFVCPSATAGATPTWLDAIRELCPEAASEIGSLLGADGLEQALRAAGLMTNPAIPIPVGQATQFEVNDVARAALGQGDLTVSPLQVALAYGALAGGGELPLPRLVDAVESPTGAWRSEAPLAAETPTLPAFTSTMASLIRRALPRHDEITGLTVSVPATHEGTPNQWYVGFAPANQPQFVLAVVLEQPTDPAAAQAIGEALLGQALLQR